MKTKLLRKLRETGRSQIHIMSYSTTNGCPSGITYGYSQAEYRGLFDFGDTHEDLNRKAERIYLNLNIDKLRKKYKKYTINGNK